MAGLLILGLTAGCKAQSPSPSAPDPALDRRIEILVRAQYDLPADVNVTIGARTPSQFSGYETLPVTIAHGSKSQVVDFLISTDNTKLVHLDTFDLTKDPADAIPIAGRPIRGNPAAKVTVVNFDDLECPYCARMHQELFPATLERYKDLVRFVYKDDPLTEMHPWAMHAAVDANCLAAQSDRRLLDLRGLPPRARPTRSRATTATWPRALPRWTASRGRKARWASWTRHAERLHRQAGRDAGAGFGQAGGAVWDRWNAGGLCKRRACKRRRSSRR